MNKKIFSLFAIALIAVPVAMACGPQCKDGAQKTMALQAANIDAPAPAAATPAPAAATAEAAPAAKSAYPLDTCPVSGEKLGGMGEPVVKVYDGREVRFCCNGCVGTFEKDKATYFKKMDTSIISAQKPVYPVDYCVVTHEKLGEAGPAVDVVVNNQLVRVCCKGCVSKVKADPAKYIGMLSAAAETKASQDAKH